MQNKLLEAAQAGLSEICESVNFEEGYGETVAAAEALEQAIKPYLTGSASGLNDWGAEAWRAPEIAEGDRIIFSEHGRILKPLDGDRHGVDYRSHYFVLVKAQYGGFALLVRHGGGQERLPIGYGSGGYLLQGFALMDSDTRYFMLHNLYRVASDAASLSAKETAQRFKEAHAEGRLKKTKIRNRDAFKIWIEPRKGEPKTLAA